MVYASDPFTGEEGYHRVTGTFENRTDGLVKLTYDGKTVTTTETHPFYVATKGWTEAVRLRAGDILVTVNGERVILEQVSHEITESPVTVYNFEVDDLHTYYVGADESDTDSFVLVHNSCAHKSASWRKQKSDYWKSHVKDSSNLYERTMENIARMERGKAPIGYDGYYIELHHVKGIANSNEIIPMTKTSHTILHKFIRYSNFVEYTI